MALKRRAFIKKSLSMLAGAGLMVFISAPRKAVAGTLDSIVKPIFMAAARYYAGSWMDNTMEQMEKLSEWFGKDNEESQDKALVAIGTSADARNAVIKEISENELFIETQPNPSSVCERSRAGKIVSDLSGTLEKASITSQLRLLNAGLEINSSNAPTIDIDIAEVFSKLSAKEISKALDASNFLTSHGYVDSKHAKLFKAAIINNLFTALILTDDIKKNPNLHAEQQTMLNRVSTVNDALTYLFNRRIRSKKLATTLKTVASETEELLITRLEHGTSKISAVDMERFEVERTYLNQQWHDEVNALQSHTALAKEFSELTCFSNKLDHEILLVQEKINLVEGVSCLNTIDKSSFKGSMFGSAV